MNELEKLRAREAQIKKRIAQIQAREKSEARKQRTSRLIKFGIVVEAMLKAGEIGIDEWIADCEKKLSPRDFQLVTAQIRPSSKDEAHLPVSPSEKQCAPAAGETIIG